MITHIRVKNFKSWEDSPKVELAPLTGFFGTNSSGKSSLLQMLLLLKQTVGSKEILFFGDETSLVKLGNFREVIHDHKHEKHLNLEFGCELQDPLTIKRPPTEDSPSYFLRPLNTDGFTFETTIQERGGCLSVESFRYGIKSDIDIEIGFAKRRRYYGSQSDDVRINIKSCYRVPVPEENRFSEDFEKISSAFENLFSHIYYLGPIRAEPQRQYHWNEMLPESVGQTGNRMIDALLVSRANQQKTLHKGKGVPIETRISEWLQEMDLAYSFSLEPISGRQNPKYDFRIQKDADGAKVTLADMGYGLSQFLPVLVNCYYAPEGSTLILEQPGMHLHPKVQSQLADLLIEVITERNLQILIESHSEHLLTRLQLRIAEGKIPASDTALYFCENENGVSTIKSLDVDPLGNIKNWPKNFFGNVRGDLVKMTREQMKLQKKAEG